MVPGKKLIRSSLAVAWMAAVAAPARGAELKEVDVTINTYKKAGIKLNVSDTRIHEGVTDGDDGSGGGTAGDGTFTNGELGKAIKKGSEEVDGGRRG